MGPGLTGDKNFEHSCEVYRRGDRARRIIYGKTRLEVLDELVAQHGDDSWMDDVVVTERRVPMGLGPMWTRATRRFDEYGERV